MKVKGFSAEERQDMLFRKMTADEKVILGAELWQLASDLAKDKITYVPAQRSARVTRAHRHNP